jgi:ribosomal protein S15P/S13E
MTVTEFSYRKNKIALIENLQGLTKVNIALENSPKDKHSLRNSQNTYIHNINKLVKFLNSVGQLSDRENRSILSLDLYSVKNLKMKFRIGRL